MQKRRVLPSPALIVATIALIAAVGGTAWATTSNSPISPGQSVSWGNVTIAPGGTNVRVAKIGPFSLIAHCTSLGAAKYFLGSAHTAFVYGEDSGPFTLSPNTTHYITEDVDSDEAFIAYSPSTGVTVHGTPFLFPKSTTGGNCEFQGTVFRTS